MARPEHGPNRPTSVQAARGQMPPSMGNTGSLTRPIGHGAQGKPPERTKRHRGPRLPSGPPMAPTGGPPPTTMYDANQKKHEK